MITITRKLAVINGFVEIPNARIEAKTAVTPDQATSAITDSGSLKVARQNFVTMPEFDSRDPYPSDWFADLRALV